MNPRLERLMRTRSLTERIVWAVITGSVLFYFFIAYLFVLQNTGAGVRAVSGLAPVFYTVAAVAAAISVVYRIRSFSHGRIREILGNYNPDASPGDELTGNTDTDDVNALNVSEKKALFLLNELQKASIINLILNEIVIMIGFVLTFLSGDIGKIIPFGVASILLCLWMFPRTESMVKKALNIFPG